jgi:hypothetical protein
MTAQKMYPGLDIKPDEVFVSDGSKCDIGMPVASFLVSSYLAFAE